MATPPWWFTSEGLYFFIVSFHFPHLFRRGLMEGSFGKHLWELLRRSGENSFDLVIAGDVLIYLGCLKKVMFEVHRVLKNGGRSFLRGQFLN